MYEDPTPRCPKRLGRSVPSSLDLESRAKDLFIFVYFIVSVRRSTRICLWDLSAYLDPL